MAPSGGMGRTKEADKQHGAILFRNSTLFTMSAFGATWPWHIAEGYKIRTGLQFDTLDLPPHHYTHPRHKQYSSVL